MIDKDEKAIQRASKAERLLADDLIIEAREHIEAELWRMFKAVTPNDKDSLDFIKSMQYFHEKYFAFFSSAVNNGKLAKANIESKQKTIKERINNLFY